MSATLICFLHPLAHRDPQPSTCLICQFVKECSMKLIVSVFAAVLLCGSVAQAQSPNIQSYQQDVFAQGVNPLTGNPVKSDTYQASAVVCGQVAFVPAATVTNPTRLEWDDPALPGKVCLVTLQSDLLPALPTGTGFVSTLLQIDSLNQASPRSAASNSFGRQGPPPVLVNVKVG